MRGLSETLKRRLDRRQREHELAWKRYVEFINYEDPKVTAKFRAAQIEAMARYDECRLILNVLRKSQPAQRIRRIK